MNERIQLLDCTLRDGCLGLEDAYLNQISDTRLSDNERIELGEILIATNADIVEIGSIQMTDDDREGFAIYQSIEHISRHVLKKKNNGQQIVALFRGPDTPIEKITCRKEGMIDGVRVILRYSELKESLEFCKALAEKGYKVYIQPMVTARYTADELNLVLEYANEMEAYALYFVDSYGYMMSEDIIRFTGLFDEKLNKKIRIGFHGHNNMNMAFANAITFINYKTDRHIIIDSTATGMGQGAGNLQTEIISNYLIKNFEKKYDYKFVLAACEYVEKYNRDGLWGYSVMGSLPAVHGVAYKYSIYLRKTYHLPYVEIQRLLDILDTMPDEIRYRYTKDNVKKLLEIGKVKV